MSNAERDSAGLTGMGGTPLAGRVALVTGASSGIGRATAKALAAAGAQVGLAARRAESLEELEEEIAQGGREAIALPTDVTDYAQAEAMARRAEETFGGVDVLVNAAGIMLPAPIAGADPPDWRRIVEVNLLGVLYATRAVLSGMLERGDGHIVNVSSTSGRVATPLFSVYAATKFGLGAFTKVLRKEVHPRRVRVTLFEPGPTRSELGSHVDPEIMESLREDSFGEVEFLGAEDVARGILWALARPERINVNEVLFRPARADKRQRGTVPPHRSAGLVTSRSYVNFRELREAEVP
jgi:NADP-dependent 3-hydroxy acid dehydrogenase YdfG